MFVASSLGRNDLDLITNALDLDNKYICIICLCILNSTEYAPVDNVNVQV